MGFYHPSIPVPATGNNSEVLLWASKTTMATMVALNKQTTITKPP
jgi:hypothetical protein